MPIYEFECDISGEVKEVILPLSMADVSSLLCPIHPNAKDIIHQATKIASLPVYPSHGAPTIIYKNPRTGEIKHAFSREQETPVGFEKIELKTPFERTAMEHELQQRDDVENEIKTERQRLQSSESRKNRQAEINTNLKGICAESTNPTQTEILMKAAMARDRKREVPKRKSNFHFAVNHVDKNNLDKG